MPAVVVTGLGLVAPHGDRPDAAFERLAQGESAVDRWTAPDVKDALAAVCAFDVTRWFTRLQLSGVDRASQLAVAAAESARADAALTDAVDPYRLGVYVGTGMGGALSIELAYDTWTRDRRVPPLTVVASMANAPAGHVAMRVQAKGPVLTYSVACASSAVAIAEAAKAIAAGEIDVAIAGGTEALLAPGTVRAWQALHTLAAPIEGEPVAAACKPFDAARRGFVLGEGAAMVVLESDAHAAARGARVYARLAGSGVTCDATHITKPDAGGQVRALRRALQRADLAPRDIGYCNAHGTATKVGDAVECASLREVWGTAIDDLRVSSTKSMHGHLLGGAGALEAVITILALRSGKIPPTAHTTEVDPACAARIVTAPETMPGLTAAISNSFAFGGTNAVLVFTRA